MYRHNQNCRRPQYETNNEYNTEFNYESENNYELSPEFEINNEMSSEMEEELENVTNEQEFEHWVTRNVHGDHRRGNIHGVMGHPGGRMAMNHLYNIARKVYPRMGSAYQRHHPGYWRRYGNYQQPYPPYPSDQSFPPDAAPDPSQQQPGYPGAAPSPTGQGGGNFKNFVLDTLNNLSQQISAGNDTLSALKSSMASSAAANYPSLAPAATDPAAAGTPPQAQPTPPQAQPAQQQEFKNGFFGYDREAEGEIRDSESSFSEETEMDLASDLLAVKNEMELDHFLGDLFKKAVGAVSGLVSGGQGNVLGGLLKTVVKKALPLAGAAAGTFFGGPIGTALGGQLGSAASNLFEMELEGMSNEDREFETARAIVRFAGNAARQVADRLTDNPQEDVRQGVTEAALRYAPGLLEKHHHYHGHHHHDHHHGHQHHSHHHHHSGTWYRKDDKIIIENI